MTGMDERRGPVVVFLARPFHARKRKPNSPPSTCRLPARARWYRPCNASRPPPILIIDGVFQSEPAVRHKEILWALSLGVPVVGAASMGALRAAELFPHMARRRA